MEQFTFQTKIGAEINEFAPQFAALRIAVFSEYPYLYNGSLAYEMEYIKTYALNKDAFMFGVFNLQGQLIGATTCIPLAHETENVQLPFLTRHIDTSNIMYFGESILLPSYRGLGLGNRFFEERERYSRSFPQITQTAFCSVHRPADHPNTPKNYRSNHDFWSKRGYTEQPTLRCTMDWQDIDQEKETTKELIFWTKNLE